MSTDSLQTSILGLKLLQTAAIISFFLLFPGYLFYHHFVATGLIPPFAAGLFGYVSLGALLAFLVLLPWNTDWLKKITGNRFVLWVLVFLLYTSVWTLAHYLFLSGDYITKAGLQSLETIIFWSCLFLIGLLLPLEATALRWSFFISFIAIFCFLLYFSVSTGDTAYNAQQIYRNTTDVSTYQGYARSVLITLLLLLAVFTSFRSRVFFILAGIFVLYLLISRSDFYAFLALSAALCIISGIRQPRYFLLLLLVAAEVVILAAPDVSPRIEKFVESLSPDEAAQAPAMDQPSATVSDAQAPAPGTASPAGQARQAADPAPAISAPAPAESAELPRLSRIFEVLDISSSKSWAGRLSLQRKALDQIAENPLMGKFGGHVLREDTGKFAKGHTGRYAHNALSAWVAYGLAGFIIYVLLTLYGFLVPARQVVLNRQDAPLWTFAFMLNFVCLLLIIVSKPVYWPLPALGWGVLAQALLNPAAGRS